MYARNWLNDMRETQAKLVLWAQWGRLCTLRWTHHCLGCYWQHTAQSLHLHTQPTNQLTNQVSCDTSTSADEKEYNKHMVLEELVK